MDSSKFCFEKLLYQEEEKEISFEGFEMGEGSWDNSKLIRSVVSNFQINNLVSDSHDSSIVNKMQTIQIINKKKWKMNQSSQIPNSNPLCLFCHKPDYSEEELGKFYSSNDVSVHYYCLLFSSALEQKGDDDEGIEGFLVKDILQELNRGRKLRCKYCCNNGATIGCNNKKCRKTYHFPCGLKKHAQFDFTDTFSSFCQDHRKFQEGENKGKEVECPICLEMMIADPRNAIWPPCCQRMWFHKICIQKVALASGLYHFKCPLCNCKDDTFQIEMQKNGIFLPDRDASWELEPHAFEELIERPNQCTSLICKCPSGRNTDIENTRWDLVICNLCGSKCVHRYCGNLSLKCTCTTRPTCQEFECSLCLEMLYDSVQRIKVQSREHRLLRRSMLMGKQEPSSDGSIKILESLNNCESASLSSLESLNSKSVNNNNSYLKNLIAKHEISLNPENLSRLVIRDLLKNRKELPSNLLEMKDYAESFPLLLLSKKMDENDFLMLIKRYDKNGDVTEITIDHIRRFIRCSFNFCQMLVLRRIFEIVFITRFCELNLQTLNNVEVTFESNKTSLINLLNLCQKSLIDVLSKCKATDLLDGNNILSNKDMNKVPSIGSIKTILQMKSLKKINVVTENIFSLSNHSWYLKNKCSFCHTQLRLRPNKTTIILSTGQLQTICSSCQTCNIFDNFYPKLTGSDESATEMKRNLSNDKLNIENDGCSTRNINTKHCSSVGTKKVTRQKSIYDYFKKPKEVLKEVNEQRTDAKRKFIYDYFKKPQPHGLSVGLHSAVIDDVAINFSNFEACSKKNNNKGNLNSSSVCKENDAGSGCKQRCDCSGNHLVEKHDNSDLCIVKIKTNGIFEEDSSMLSMNDITNNQSSSVKKRMANEISLQACDECDKKKFKLTSLL